MKVFCWRAAMVIAETALAVVLLGGAGLLIQTVFKLQKLDIGFTTENVLRMETQLPVAQYDTLEKRAQFYEQVLERVEAIPGVIAAGYSTAAPLDWKGGTNGYIWMGKPAPGYRVRLLDDAGQEHQEAEICLALDPPPLGLMQGYQGDDGAIQPLLTHLVKGARLSADDRRSLRILLDELEKEGKKPGKKA